MSAEDLIIIRYRREVSSQLGERASGLAQGDPGL